MTTLLSHPPTGAPPSYSQLAPNEVELSRFDSASPSILSSAPPSYDEAAPSAGTFKPTLHFQIDTPGKPWFSLPMPLHPDPIPVFSLHPDDSSLSTVTQSTPQYISNRPQRSSGSCYLTSPTTTTTSSSSAIHALSTTTYRFGPNRPPLIRLFSPHSAPLSHATINTLLFSKDKDVNPNPNCRPVPHTTAEDENGDGYNAYDTFAITPLGLLTRAVAFRTRLGTFQWRYASRKERQAVASSDGPFPGNGEVSCLLVLERVVRVARSRNQTVNPHHSYPDRAVGSDSGVSSKDEEEVRTPVAYFLRGPAYRTPGTGASAAGNGGRLVMDLGLWEGDRGEADGTESKVDREMAEVMVVTTCLVMLKREVDRRRAQQIAILAGAVGGGGS